MTEISSELRAVLRRVKLGPLMATLPERATLARQNRLSHLEFLELVLSDEVERRDRTSAERRARAAHLEAGMVLEAWDPDAAVSFDRELWSELTSLRFLDDGAGVLILGPVGVGKTRLASALGHIAVRRRRSVLMGRTDHLLKELKASRLDGTYEAEMRRLIRVDLLILDDFLLRSLDATETSDIYELVVERHRRASTVVTSNRDPSEWLAAMADPLLAQSAVDRLQSAPARAGRRRRVLPQAAAATKDGIVSERNPGGGAFGLPSPKSSRTIRKSDHRPSEVACGRGKAVVPSRWQATRRVVKSAVMRRVVRGEDGVAARLGAATSPREGTQLTLSPRLGQIVADVIQLADLSHTLSLSLDRCPGDSGAGRHAPSALSTHPAAPKEPPPLVSASQQALSLQGLAWPQAYHLRGLRLARQWHRVATVKRTCEARRPERQRV